MKFVIVVLESGLKNSVVLNYYDLEVMIYVNISKYTCRNSWADFSVRRFCRMVDQACYIEKKNG